MRIEIVSFTKGGNRVCGRLVKRFRELGETCAGFVQRRFLNETGSEPGIGALAEPIGDWTGQRFASADALIYIGAAGIAVRAIAPYLKDKMTDPAVLVVDEQGQFVISLLSGHMGGANRLAARTAEILGAVPVITTSSEVQGLTAVDVWAKDRGLLLSDRILAKKAAAELVNGGCIGFYSDFSLAEALPEGWVTGQICPVSLWVTVHTTPGPDHMLSLFLTEDAQVLRLIPKVLVLGIGCKKGVSKEQVDRVVDRVLREQNLDPRAVKAAASIDIKREEAGLCAFAKERGLPFAVYSAEELEQAEGAFAESAFVRSVTGTGNVCERAALLAAGAGARLVVPKTAQDGVTVAVAQQEWRITRREEER